MSKGKYCRCRNTFCISCCDLLYCEYPDYWKFGVGKIKNTPAAAVELALFQNGDGILFQNDDKLEFN